MSIHNTFEEARDLENQLYALILPILAKYEARGFNSHQRAQNISSKAVEEMRQWILKNQRAHLTEETE